MNDTKSLKSIRVVSTIVFVCIITLLAWQSDDAYHAYVMAKNLVLGNGFVYNIGERATASSCPLFTLVIAAGYFVIRKMYVVSILICVVLSTLAYQIVVKYFCRTKWQIYFAFAAFVGSSCFISYTTSGLENCQLFFLSALFLKIYFSKDTYQAKELLLLAILISLIAMTRMDAVLMFVPMIVYLYLAKRENVSFIKAVGLGALGLCPFILWELFSIFYYGFPFPNTAYVKLGTDIPLIEYLYRGVQYVITTALCDVVLMIIPLITVIATLLLKKAKYLYLSAGIVLYGCYVLYIGGDFMLGRHFTVLFFMSVICLLEMFHKEEVHIGKIELKKAAIAALVAGIVFKGTTNDITSQFLFGNTFTSPISDERAGYFKYTSLFNNVVSYVKTGELCVRDAWNEEGIENYRKDGFTGAIMTMVPGISIYYNNDLYLNDLYGLGDPFLSKLPAVREENWRIGHMWRESPYGYNDSILFGGNRIENESIKEYYEVIKLITRGDLFDSDRIRAVIDINLGRYDYLLEQYKSTLDENGRQKPKEAQE